MIKKYFLTTAAAVLLSKYILFYFIMYEYNIFIILKKSYLL